MRTGRGRPNVVVILIDTLRADHLGCYGYARPTSPCIDAIAAGGVVYERAISPAAWTPPAHASLFTGAYPSRHGVERSRLVLSPALVPLPEALRRHGYRTYGVSSNYWLSRETRFDRGFDHFVESWQLVQARGVNPALFRQERRQGLGLDGVGERRGLARLGAAAVNGLYERATRALRRRFHAWDDGAWRVNRVVRRWAREWSRSDEPFFAFIHYMEPHLRYAPPGRYRTLHAPAGVSRRRLGAVNQDPWRYLAGRAPMSEADFEILRALYDGEVSYVDARVGEIYGLLRQRGLLRNTFVVVTSDHGENLGEHQLMDHAYCLYDTLLRVPLIVSGPAEFPPGERVPDQVQTLDLFPTILDLADIRDEDLRAQAQGRPLFQASLQDRVAVAEYLEPQPPVAVLRQRYPDFDGSRFDRALRAVRTARHKYIWASDGRDELYDLEVDPGETRNLVSTEPETAAAMRAWLADWVRSAGAGVADRGLELELDTVTRRRLEELGYLS